MRIAVLSDVHANLQALEAVLADLPAVDQIWFLGDSIDYGARPNECLDLQAELNPDRVLLGNHDLAILDPAELAGFNPAARAAGLWTSEVLSGAHRLELAQLPSEAMAQGARLVHASPRNPVHEYVHDLWVAAANLDSLEETLCFHGHTHRPAVWWRGGDGSTLRLPAEGRMSLPAGRSLVNPGSVGQPRDGDSRAAYLLFEPPGTLEFRRVVYDVSGAQADIRGAGLPEVLAERLGVGM